MIPTGSDVDAQILWNWIGGRLVCVRFITLYALYTLL
jgi:hypothetical protein